MESYYMITDSIDRDDCEFLYKFYDKKNFIKKGAYGSVYELCEKNTDICGFVLKIIKYKKDIFELSGSEELSFKNIKKNWEKEIKIIKKLNNCQYKAGFKFSPIFYDAWYCSEKNETSFFIVMEKYDGSLTNFINHYKTLKEKELAKSFLITNLKLLDIQLRFIHDNCNICLNDIKLDNILYKQVSKYSYEFVFTDFGNSTEIVNEKCKKEDQERFRRNINLFNEELEKH